MSLPALQPAFSFSPFPERSIRTYHDWQAFVRKPDLLKPKMPAYQEYEAASAAQRKAFNESRAYYHGAFEPILVPVMERIHQHSLRLARTNLAANAGARPGIIIDGISTVGKSTTAMQLGRRYEKLITKDFSVRKTPSGADFIPVVFISLPGECTIMNFNKQLAAFYHIPHSERVKESFLTNRIKEYAADCGTSLIIIDDIHFLRVSNRSAEWLNNHIKHLANSISATFIYAGIDLDNTGLMSEGKSVEQARMSQTRHRFKKFEMKAFDYEDATSRVDFFRVLCAFEHNLLLFKHPLESLAHDMGSYIFGRTGGYIGPMSLLIREGAALAIKNKTERISLDILKGIKLDYDSEIRRQQYQKMSKSTRNRAA